MRTPRPLCGCHQCCTSPSTNWRAAARRMCSRATAGLGVHERHDVLQLIAESVRAARLIERRARPHAAGERLIERPAIHHRVERGLRRAHADDGEPSLPLRDRLVHRRARARRVAVRLGQARAPRPPTRPRRGRTDSLRVSPGASSRTHWSAAHGSIPAPVLASSATSLPSARGAVVVPLRPRNSRRSPVCPVDRLAHRAERDPVGELRIEGVAREDGAARRDRTPSAPDAACARAARRASTRRTTSP